MSGPGRIRTHNLSVSPFDETFSESFSEAERNILVMLQAHISTNVFNFIRLARAWIT